MLVADTARARAYLDRLLHVGARPVEVLVLERPGAIVAAAATTSTPLFDNTTPILEKLDAAALPYAVLPTDDINDDRVVAAVADLPADLIVFAGPAGAIAGSELLGAGKSFLHVHPGRLPEYRGSTPMYYSLLAEAALEASAILLAPEIDQGPMVGHRVFPLPDEPAAIDVGYDPWMRAELMADVVRAYLGGQDLRAVTQEHGRGTTYYVIHPVLKHLAIMRAENERRRPTAWLD